MDCPSCGAFMGASDHGICPSCKKSCGCSFDPTSSSDYCSRHRPRTGKMKREVSEAQAVHDVLAKIDGGVTFEELEKQKELVLGAEEQFQKSKDLLQRAETARLNARNLYFENRTKFFNEKNKLDSLLTKWRAAK